MGSADANQPPLLVEKAPAAGLSAVDPPASCLQIALHMCVPCPWCVHKTAFAPQQFHAVVVWKPHGGSQFGYRFCKDPMLVTLGLQIASQECRPYVALLAEPLSLSTFRVEQVLAATAGSSL